MFATEDENGIVFRDVDVSTFTFEEDDSRNVGFEVIPKRNERVSVKKFHTVCEDKSEKNNTPHVYCRIALLCFYCMNEIWQDSV